MAEITQETSDFVENADVAFRELFDIAKSKNELHFALALAPEFRGEQGPGWCTWEETKRAFDEYLSFLNSQSFSPFKIRVALSFYSHLSEASGYYETPKNLLRIVSGERYRMWPFLDLNRVHAETGKVIAPNANKIFSDLIGHAKAVGLCRLADVFKFAFDPDIRNGYAHADYIIWTDGIRLRRQAGGLPRVIEWNEFEQSLLRAINFYANLRSLINEHVFLYRTPKDIVGSMNGEPMMNWRIEVNSEGMFSISSR